MVNEMKICTCCGKEKLATAEFFYRSRKEACGFISICKECKKIKDRQQYINLTDEQRDKRRQQCRVTQKRYRENNPHKHRESVKKWRENNKDKCRDKLREYRAINPEKFSGYLKKSNGKRRELPINRLNDSFRARLRRAVAEAKSGRPWEKLVGYSLEDLFNHLEARFKPGMTWDNYGSWHIDHIKPISHFNYNSYEDVEFLMAWSLSNLQPLWALENIAKGNRI